MSEPVSEQQPTHSPPPGNAPQGNAQPPSGSSDPSAQTADAPSPDTVIVVQPKM